MTARRRTYSILSLLLVLTVSCGDDSSGPVEPTDSGTALIEIWMILTGSGGGSPMAGDTLRSEVELTNTGDGTARDLILSHSIPDRFELTSPTSALFDPTAEQVPDLQSALADSLLTDPTNLEPGENLILVVSLLIPEFFPDDWTQSFGIRVRYDADGDDSTPPVEQTAQKTSPSIENSGLDLALLAPGVPEVYVAGSFNGWSPTNPEYLLFQDPEGRRWGITIPDAVPGPNGHEYKYNLNDPQSGRLEWIADPRATHLHPDGFGGYNTVIGRLLPQPVTPLPGGIDPTNLVIYELLTHDFSPAGTFQAVIDGMEGGPQGLFDLGINAIELLPIKGVSPGFNWGYEPRFYYAVEPDYGTPEDFARLVTTAHENGVAVILDMVFNHIGQGAPLQKIDEMGINGTFIHQSQPDVFGMRQLNWFSDDMREFFLDVSLFWIEQFGIDGFRMDFVDPSDYQGYRWWRDELKALHPDFFIIGEDFSFPPSNSIHLAGFDT